MNHTDEQKFGGLVTPVTVLDGRYLNHAAMHMPYKKSEFALDGIPSDGRIISFANIPKRSIALDGKLFFFLPLEYRLSFDFIEKDEAFSGEIVRRIDMLGIAGKGKPPSRRLYMLAECLVRIHYIIFEGVSHEMRCYDARSMASMLNPKLARLFRKLGCELKLDISSLPESGYFPVRSARSCCVLFQLLMRMFYRSSGEIWLELFEVNGYLRADIGVFEENRGNLSGNAFGLEDVLLLRLMKEWGIIHDSSFSLCDGRFSFAEPIVYESILTVRASPVFDRTREKLELIDRLIELVPDDIDDD